MAKRKSGGADLLAGLVAVGASSVMSKPKVTLPPAPPDFERLNSYYCDVLEGSYAPEDFPSDLPLSEFGQKFDAKGQNFRLWSELAAYHKTSVRSLKKEYLKWRCDKDGMPYSEAVLEASVMCQGRLGDPNVKKFAYDPVWAINKYMEWDEPKSAQQNMTMPVSEEYIRSLYYSPDDSSTATEAIKKNNSLKNYEPKSYKLKNEDYFRTPEPRIADNTLFGILVLVCLIAPLVLAAKYDDARLLLSFFIFAIPVIILRCKANINTRRWK